MSFLLILLLFSKKIFPLSERVVELDLCKNYDKLSLGTSCLSDCDGNCSGEISPDLIFFKESEIPALTTDCPSGKSRIVCTPGSPLIANYPVCELMDATYCTGNDCACWSTCITKSCDTAGQNTVTPFVQKDDQVTNSGCLMPSYRVLCVN